MQKGTILENILVTKLIFGGSGLAIADDGRKILIAGGAIPGSIVNIRVIRDKKNYIEGQIHSIVKKSPHEREIPSHWQEYGGAKWLRIPYDIQLGIKQDQVREAFHHLSEATTNTTFHPIIASPKSENYRNKVEFSWGKYISEKEGVHHDFRFGFHAPAQFDRIIDCTYCVLADEETNAIFHSVNKLSRSSELPTYDPKTHKGFWRHLVVRRTLTGDTMVIFSVNTKHEGFHQGKFTQLVAPLMNTFPSIKSLFLLKNTGMADIVTGESECLFGAPTITETLLGKQFQINPKSFFQTNSLGAEKLYAHVRNSIKTRGGHLLDLYAGTGTIGLILSDLFASVTSVEIVEEATRDGQANALLNGITNVEFSNQKAEEFVNTFTRSEGMPLTIVIDPPRDGMHPDAVKLLPEFGADEIVYVSCNPATLARDLAGLTEKYTITDVTPVDMFPHTHHVETVVRLEKK